MQKTIRLLMLTQWFEPEPAFKGLSLARELVRQGFEVEVVTGFPNYPGGRVYPGYKLKWLHREFIDGVHITRLPLYPSHDQSAIRRSLNYLSFALTSLLYGLFIARRADVMYAYHPPLTTGIVASLLRNLRGTPVVYDIQDIWPDTLRATGMLNNKRVLRGIGAVCSWVYRTVDRIVVLSPGFKQLLVERGVSKSKVTIIYNWADEASLVSPTGETPFAFASDGLFRILFAGNIGKAQALETVLKAAALLQQQGSRVYWVMLGGGIEVERLKSEAVRLQLTNVAFLPAVPMTKVHAYLRAADALLVHLRKDPLFNVTIPSKTQAYMAVGKPLLMAVGGDAADLINHSGGGVVVESENPSALAEAAELLSNTPIAALEVMGQHAQLFYQHRLSFAVGVQRLAEALRESARTRK